MNRKHVEDRLSLLVQSLAELQPVLEPGVQAFVDEPMRHHAGERLLEILVECAGSINREVGLSLGIPRTDYYSSFFSLVTAGWLDVATAKALAALAGLRNKDIHHYQSLNLSKLHKTLLESVPHWEAYLASLTRNLKVA